MVAALLSRHRRLILGVALVMLPFLVIVAISSHVKGDVTARFQVDKVRDNFNKREDKLDIVFKHLVDGQKSLDTISGVTMAATDDKFNAERVLKLFTACREADDSVTIDCYTDAYEELCKLFKVFGTAFSFVASDVEEKIGILREYRKADNGEEYKSIQSMIGFEVKSEITDNKKKASGSRTLLRLHRALEFISALLGKIKDTDNKVKFSTEAVKAYDDTLAKYHPWLIKKGVHVAMMLLPHRPDLLKKMNLEDTPEKMSSMTKLIDELNLIYKITQDVYAKDNLLDLP